MWLDSRVKFGTVPLIRKQRYPLEKHIRSSARFTGWKSCLFSTSIRGPPARKTIWKRLCGHERKKINCQVFKSEKFEFRVSSYVDETEYRGFLFSHTLSSNFAAYNMSTLVNFQSNSLSIECICINSAKWSLVRVIIERHVIQMEPRLSNIDSRAKRVVRFHSVLNQCGNIVKLYSLRSIAAYGYRVLSKWIFRRSVDWKQRRVDNGKMRSS